MCKNCNFWCLQREYKKSLEQEIKGKGMLALATDTPDFMRARNATEILSQVWILNVFCIAFLEQWFPECELQAPDMKWRYYELIIYVKDKKNQSDCRLIWTEKIPRVTKVEHLD